MILIAVNQPELLAIIIAVSLEIEIVLAIFAILREAIFVRDILNDLDVESAVQKVRLAPRTAQSIQLPGWIVQLNVEQKAIALG